MKFSDNMPIHMQIVNTIKAKIVTGEISANSKLPSVRKIAKTLSVNQNTIMKAYKKLEALGLLYTKTGIGIFVKADISMREELKNEMTMELIDVFIFKMKGLGLEKNEIIMSVRNYGEK